MKRSDERTEFLQDVLSTFAEAGTGLISCTARFRRNGLDYEVVTVVFTDLGQDEIEHEITIETVAKGLATIRRGPVKYLSSHQRAHLIEADRDNDAGMIDSVDSCAIIEIATFGQVVYA